MEGGAVGRIEPVAGIERQEVHFGTLRERRGFVDDEAAIVNASLESHKERISPRNLQTGAKGPEVRYKRRMQLGLLGVLVLAYLGAGIWASRARGSEVKASLRTGAAFGLLFGVAGAVSLTLEYLGHLRPPFNAIVTASEMGVMVVLFGAAATVTLRRSGSWPPALLAAVLSSLVGTSLICAYGFLLQWVVLQPRGVGSFENTLKSASEHMAISPIVAVLAGMVAIVATFLHRSSRPRVRLALALWDVVQGAVGISLLVFAASLVRPERPPYVMGGMLLTAIALAGAPALLGADAPS